MTGAKQATLTTLMLAVNVSTHTTILIILVLYHVEGFSPSPVTEDFST